MLQALRTVCARDLTREPSLLPSRLTDGDREVQRARGRGGGSGRGCMGDWSDGAFLTQ